MVVSSMEPDTVQTNNKLLEARSSFSTQPIIEQGIVRIMNELAANLLRYLVQNTIEASLLIALILAARILLRERLSMRWQYALWFLVCIKILIPWTPSSAISLGH